MSTPYPAGLPDGERHRCLICRERISAENSVYWVSDDQDINPGADFGGYFCCVLHRRMWMAMDREEQARHIWGNVEAYARIQDEYAWEGDDLYGCYDIEFEPIQGTTAYDPDGQRLTVARFKGFKKREPARYGDKVKQS